MYKNEPKRIENIIKKMYSVKDVEIILTLEGLIVNVHVDEGVHLMELLIHGTSIESAIRAFLPYKGIEININFL